MAFMMDFLFSQQINGIKDEGKGQSSTNNTIYFGCNKCDELLCIFNIVIAITPQTKFRYYAALT